MWAEENKIRELTVYLIDRYLSTKKIDKKNFQLLGCIAFAVAMRYQGGYFDFEEIRDISGDDF